MYRTLRWDYGPSQEWIYGIEIIYKRLLQEERFDKIKKRQRRKSSFFPLLKIIIFFLTREEYLVCEFACLLSSVGGYVGLFFGISIFEFIFSLESIVSYTFKTYFSNNKSNINVQILFLLICIQLHTFCEVNGVNY